MATHFIAIQVPSHITDRTERYLKRCKLKGYIIPHATSHITMGLVNITEAWLKSWNSLKMQSAPCIRVAGYRHFNNKILYLHVECNELSKITQKLHMRDTTPHITVFKTNTSTDLDNVIENSACPLVFVEFYPISLDLCLLGSAGLGEAGYYKVQDRAFFDAPNNDDAIITNDTSTMG